MIEKDVVANANQELRKVREASNQERAVTHEHFIRMLNAMISVTNFDGQTDDPVTDVDTPLVVETATAPKGQVDPDTCKHDNQNVYGVCNLCGTDVRAQEAMAQAVRDEAAANLAVRDAARFSH